jgi:hypothetical protein
MTAADLLVVSPLLNTFACQPNISPTLSKTKSIATTSATCRCTELGAAILSEYMGDSHSPAVSKLLHDGERRWNCAIVTGQEKQRSLNLWPIVCGRSSIADGTARHPRL